MDSLLFSYIKNTIFLIQISSRAIACRNTIESFFERIDGKTSPPSVKRSDIFPKSGQ